MRGVTTKLRRVNEAVEVRPIKPHLGDFRLRFFDELQIVRTPIRIPVRHQARELERRRLGDQCCRKQEDEKQRGANHGNEEMTVILNREVTTECFRTAAPGWGYCSLHGRIGGGSGGSCQRQDGL